jgi:lipopolysaccharide transport system permease protein
MVNISLIIELTKRDYTERFAGDVLGSMWALIWPLVNLFIYIIIFGKLMGSRMPENANIYSYSIYLIVGLVPWIAFSNSIARSTSVFLDKKHLISKIKLSLPSLIIYIILSETITFVISMLLFFVFLICTGYHFKKTILLVPFLYYLQQLFAFGFGLLTATLTVFIRDLREIIGIMLQFWFWFTPIVYLRLILPDFLFNIMQYNPAYVIIQSYRNIFIFNKDPYYGALILLTILVHVMILISYKIFRLLEKDVRDFL